MSISHEYYKKYKDAEQKRINAQRRESKYISDYEKDERISQLEYEKADREEKEDFKRGWNLLSWGED